MRDFLGCGAVSMSVFHFDTGEVATRLWVEFLFLVSILDVSIITYSNPVYHYCNIFIIASKSNIEGFLP